MINFLEKKTARFWLILVLVFTIPTFYQLLRPGFFFMQDDLQAFRVHQMFECFKDLQIPCRWVPDMGYQYGYPQFLFYPPSVYYIGSLIHLIGIQIIDSVKILFIAGLVLSTFFMYLFLKTFLEGEVKEKSFSRVTLPSFVGAMLYTYAPYKALEVYVRGALSEFWSLVFYPLIFLSIYLLITKKRLTDLVFFSLSVGGLMLTHNLMTLIFAPIAIVWTLVLLILKKEKWVIFKIIAGGFLGIGLASFFTLPVIFEGKYVHLETLQGGYFDYRQHFVNVSRLFLSNHWGYGSSGFGQDNDLTLSTGQIHSLLAFIGLMLSVIFFKKQKKLAGVVIIFSLIELLVLFLIHQKSSFIWAQLPILWWLQFPWRFLTDSIFLLSVLGAIAIYFANFINKKTTIILSSAVFLAILILHSSFFTPKNWQNITDKQKFSEALWEKQLTISIFDYLPVYAKFPPNHKAPEMPEVLEGEAVFNSYKKRSNFQVGEVEFKKESVIRLPLLDFPGMKVLVNGRSVDHWNNDCRGQEYCFGQITFKLPEGQYKIKAQLEDTPVRSIGNMITLLTVCILFALVYISNKNEKNSTK